MCSFLDVWRLVEGVLLCWRGRLTQCNSVGYFLTLHPLQFSYDERGKTYGHYLEFN